MSKHTPGPWWPLWHAAKDEAVAIVQKDKPEMKVVDTRPGAAGISAADAHLIAAAPELLEAFELLLEARNLQFHTWDCDESNCVCDETLRDARAAIRKAKGEV